MSGAELVLGALERADSHEAIDISVSVRGAKLVLENTRLRT